MEQREALRQMGEPDLSEVFRKSAKEPMAAERRGAHVPEHLDFK